MGPRSSIDNKDRAMEKKTFVYCINNNLEDFPLKILQGTVIGGGEAGGGGGVGVATRLCCT